MEWTQTADCSPMEKRLFLTASLPFLMHSAVVCEVDVGWWVQEPAGCLAAGFLILSGAPLKLPSFVVEDEDGEPWLLRRTGCVTSQYMRWCIVEPGENRSMSPLSTALHHRRWYSSTCLSGMRSEMVNCWMSSRW